MAGNSKLLISEQDGVDLGLHSEYQLDITDMIQKAGSCLYTFTGDLLTQVDLYSSNSQVTANRVADVIVSYNAEDQPETETWQIYDTTDGTTVLRTTVYTHTWSGDIPVKTETA